MKIEIGMPAPAFSLFDSEKNKVSLSDFQGQNVLLLFFPLAFTGVCTRQLCSVRDNIGHYDHMKAKVLGISVDSLYTLAKFKEEQSYNFPLLSDFNKEVSKQYNSLYETFGFGMKGVSKRSAFIIDKNGIIQYAEILENAGEIPSFDAIQARLASLS
jgi:glutaredoxin-dependent peroxiredoxin